MRFLRRHLDMAQLGLAVLDQADVHVSSHLSSCQTCRRRRDRLASRLAAGRVAAHAAADAAFPAAALDAQRHSILQRLSRATSARVLPFPGADPAAAAPAAHRPTDRRWVLVAAAAGLLVGVAVGRGPLSWRTAVPAAVAAMNSLSATGTPDLRRDDTLLSDVEEVLTREIRPEFEALDGLTPIAYETR